MVSIKTDLDISNVAIYIKKDNRIAKLDNTFHRRL